MKKLKIFIIISLMMLFWVWPKSVSAKSFSSFQTKMINGNSNYRIYQGMTHRGPVGSVGLARTFKYGNFQASAVKKVGKSKYYFVWIDGHKAGWLNQRVFLRNKISVVKKISLVNNPYYSFPTKDAINFATDSTGTVVNPNKVKASQDEVLSNSASEHKITFTYGKAHAHTVVEVRGDAQEGVGVADKPEQTGKSASSWFKHYRTSGNWGKGASYAPETKPHVLKSGSFKLKTYFYQPATLSQGRSQTGMVGPVPEGMTISNGSMYATMYKSSHNTRAHIVAYKLKNVPNRYIMQKLPWLPWGQFTRLASKIKISPYIKLGHGQAFIAS